MSNDNEHGQGKRNEDNGSEDGARSEHDERDRTVEILVNDKPVRMPRGRATGAEVKAAAIAQGVAIQADFVLSEKRGHKWHIVGDSDEVNIKKDDEFLAVAPDDNS